MILCRRPAQETKKTDDDDEQRCKMLNGDTQSFDEELD